MSIRTPSLFRTLLLPALLTLAACGGDDDVVADAGADSGGTSDASSDVTAGEYPGGPYGTGVGDTIANLSFVRPDGSSVSLGDLRSAGTKAIFVNTASGWCTACREEQPALEALHQELADDGLVVVVAYFEDSEFNAATAAGAAAWQSTYSLSFPVVADIPFVLSEYYDESQTPMNLVIEADRMRIAHISTGANLTEVRSIIDLLLR